MELDDLNPEQKAAVEHDSGPILVVAGAGTGKTQVITRRIAHLITSRRAKPEEILAVTFTDRAAAEMEERLDLLLPYGTFSTRVMTFHSFGDEILRQYGADIGLDGRMRLLNQTQQLIFLKQRIDQLKLDYFAPLSDPVALLADLASYFGRLKEELVTAKAYLDWAGQQAKGQTGEAEQLEAHKHLELAHAYDQYQKLLRREGLIDFADQVSLALELLQKRPNVLAELRRQIRYILVDEFQDTNLAQARLVELVAGDKGNIMVVGDDDQSIYRFRGAAISNILGFKARYPKAKEIVLVRNYRSTQAILDSAYQLIQHNNPWRLESESQIDKHLIGQKRGQSPEVARYQQLADEAEALATSIKQKIKRGSKPGSIAVLVRKRQQVGQILAALERYDIAYQYGGQERLFDQSIIRLMLSFLQYIVDPKDDWQLYALLSSPAYAIDATILARHSSGGRRRNRSLDEEIRSNDLELAVVLEQIDAMRQRSQELTVGELLYSWIDETGYLKQLTQLAEADPGTALAINDLAKFFGLLEEFQRVSKDRSASGYVSSLGLLEGEVDAAREPDMESRGDAVQVMTIHRSKGLEFETVYLPDLTAGAFPARRQFDKLRIPDELLREGQVGDPDWHLSEERRLMYVAITRAKTNLITSYSIDHGGVRQKKPSIFLAEAFGHTGASETKPQRAPLEQIGLFGQLGRSIAPTKPSFYRGDALELTVHQIDDYLSCPLNFYWKHVLNVPQPVQPIMLYGTAIHATINYYFRQRQRGQVSYNALWRHFLAVWQAEGYISRGQEQRRRRLAQETLKRFYDREEATQRWPSYSELPFQFDLPGQVRIRGRFDAVYADGDDVEIRDFKTSQVEASDKAAEKARSSRQLALYALGWYQTNQQIPTKLTLDYVETGQIGETTKSKADLDDLAAEVAEAASGIRAGNFPPGQSHFHCIHDKL